MSTDRRSGFWDRAKETMAPAARRSYQDGWVRELVAHAWDKAPGVRRRMERAGLAPERVGGVEQLARLPVIKKSEMPELQKADPPFGGFCAVPLDKVRRIFMSPGPIFEPMGPEPGAWHLEIRALETANEVSVHLGSSTGGQTDSRQEIWRGPLRAGQVRSLDVSFSPPPGATSVWAEAQVTTGSTTILRAGAVVPTAAATRAAGAPRGTVLVDPASGESVVEYPGRVQR